jgi:hypothetical protein
MQLQKGEKCHGYIGVIDITLRPGKGGQAEDLGRLRKDLERQAKIPRSARGVPQFTCPFRHRARWHFLEKNAT